MQHSTSCPPDFVAGDFFGDRKSMYYDVEGHRGKGYYADYTKTENEKLKAENKAAETSQKAKKKRNRFLLRHKEKQKMNQYWFSPHTIETMVAEVETYATAAAFLSTPSIYFSLDKDSSLRKNSKVFDIDDQWKKDPGFVLYDFNMPEEIPKELHHTFDYVVIDPPFVTYEVWEKYAEAAKLLLKEGTEEDPKTKKSIPMGKILLSTIHESAEFLKKLLGCHPQVFRPSIPNLIYQYDFYCNYPDSSNLSNKNQEIDG